ncbi:MULTISPECIES: hypothetical protein [Streptomyces]|uniref:Uncharacterized protein n=1 Tax=Streptomyces evansiae TaxID=3075535 RepID=A0ABU2R3C6_9ACTN|nr:MULTISPECIES: hypothetical protein [unclassified Streptomyces]MDT0409919.1 hypothetical protein [Streptomyces sp. DSM 41979]MYQ59993.1 hypothetical protein [Streptomyces sp. SID4926]SCE40382.1 hypothetical protein GA0115252_146430 [Streptomyces sp. DfronAA-171]
MTDSPAADLRERVLHALRTARVPHTPRSLPFPAHHQPGGDTGGFGWCALCARDADALADAVLAVLPAPADRTAEVEELRTELERRTLMLQASRDQVTRLTADRAAVLTDDERAMLTYALDQAQEHRSREGFTDEDQAAVDSLRRLTTEAPGGDR